MSKQLDQWFRALCAAAFTGIILAATANSAAAQVYINEMYIDPNGGEGPREYVELRGPSGMSLNNHWLIVIENENDSVDGGGAGSLDLAIDLTGVSLGSNGFLAMRRASGSPFTINGGANVMELPETLFENSGATYMLINKGTGPTPMAGMVLDGNVDNDNDPMTTRDGLDFPGVGQEGWSILDSIGYFSEVTEAVFGRTYAPVAFGFETPGQMVDYIEDITGEHIQRVFQPNLEPGQVYIPMGHELEYLARYGNSTGNTYRDWHVSNISDGTPSASSSQGKWAQAGTDPHGFPRIPMSEAAYEESETPDCDYACYLANYLESESSQFVPYDTLITNTIGAPNYPLNQSFLPWDFNHDGNVNGLDYALWRNTLGQMDPAPGLNPLAANVDRDGTVDEDDFEIWKYHYGESLPLPPGGGGQAIVPEPASWTLVSAALAALALRRSRRI